MKQLILCIIIFSFFPLQALSPETEAALSRFDYDQAICLIKDDTALSKNPELLLALCDAYIYKTFTLPKAERLQVYQKARKVLISNQQNFKDKLDYCTRLSLVTGQMASLSKPSQKGQLIKEMHYYTRSALQIDSLDALAVFLDGYLKYRLSILNWFERLLAKTFIGHLPDTSLEKAKTRLTKAVKLDSTNVYFNFVLGRTYFVMRDYQKASEILQKALLYEDRNIIDTIHKEEAHLYLQAIKEEKYTFTP